MKSGSGMTILRIVFTVFYAVLWVGGVFSYVFLGGPPTEAGWAAPAFLGVAAALVFLAAPRSEWRILAFAGAAAFLAEILGVYTGFPFGAYEYTAVLYPRVAGVPLAMACAWILLFAYVRRMLAGCRIAPRWQPVAGAAWMVGLDLLIDPLAAGPLQYWTWKHPGLYCGVPLSNFAGWFLVSLLLFALTRRPPPATGANDLIGLSVVVFFTVIALAHPVWPAALAGVGLCALHFTVARRRPSGDSGQSG